MKTTQLGGFECHDCGNGCAIWLGRVPRSLLMTDSQFESMWNVHPQAHAEIRIHGRKVPIPRWQQAYGLDYHFSGEVNRALPIPGLLAPLLAWCKDAIDDRLNGLFAELVRRPAWALHRPASRQHQEHGCWGANRYNFVWRRKNVSASAMEGGTGDTAD